MLASAALAQPAPIPNRGQRFVSISFHDVADRRDELDPDAVTTERLAQFFDWVKAGGWNAVSLDDLLAARAGTRPLPDKAILITFDDGYKSLYTKVFPLLRIYRFPVVSALVGSWMETHSGVRAGGDTVLYGDRIVPRANFISWAEAREMQASGLVEFASHSYDLHKGVQANPQGSMTPAAVTWRYDPATRRYEDDSQYAARIRADLTRSRDQMAQNLGRAPRAMVWPFGRYTGPAIDIAKQLGFRFSMTLDAEPAWTGDLYSIHRYFPTQNPALGEIVDNLRYEPQFPRMRRIACVRLDELAAAPSQAAQDEMLGAIIENIRKLGANAVRINANALLPSPDAPMEAVYFPTKFLPVKADLLSRVSWQLRSRAGQEIFLRLPIDPAARAIGAENVPALFADMMKYTISDGISIDMLTTPTDASGGGPTIVPVVPGDVRARRAALDPANYTGRRRLALEVWRATAYIDNRQRLMVNLDHQDRPPDWVDTALLPPTRTAAETGALARQLRAEGWLRPDAASRLTLSLPEDPRQQVEAMRLAQRQGVSAVALCPYVPPLPAAPALAHAFSASTYFRLP